MEMKGSLSRITAPWTRLCIAMAICQGSLCTDTSETSTLLRQRRLPVAQSRVVGGREVPVGKFSFFGFWYGGNCGATLVHTDMFLTAAHVSFTSCTTKRIWYQLVHHHSNHLSFHPSVCLVDDRQ
jgi:hypothetical protein